MLIIRRSKFYYTASGIITPVGGRQVHRLRADYVLIIRRSKLYYRASGIITPVGGRPVHRLREAICGSPVLATVLLRDPLLRGVMGFAMECVVLVFRGRSDREE